MTSELIDLKEFWYFQDINFFTRFMTSGSLKIEVPENSTLVQHYLALLKFSSDFWDSWILEKFQDHCEPFAKHQFGNNLLILYSSRNSK